jgi:hypothetical protein
MNDIEQRLVMQLATLRHQIMQAHADAHASGLIFPMIPDIERKVIERTCFLLVNIACGSLGLLPSAHAPSDDVVAQLCSTYAGAIQALQVAVHDVSLAGISHDVAAQIMIDVFVKP